MDLRTQAADILMGLTGSDDGVAQLAEDRYRDKAIPALLHLLGGALPGSGGPGPGPSVCSCCIAPLHTRRNILPAWPLPPLLLARVLCRVTSAHTRRILIPGQAVRCLTVAHSAGPWRWARGRRRPSRRRPHWSTSPCAPRCALTDIAHYVIGCRSTQ